MSHFTICAREIGYWLVWKGHLKKVVRISMTAYKMAILNVDWVHLVKTGCMFG